MNKLVKRLFLAIAFASMCACSGDDTMLSSQVENFSEVRFSFFDATMEEFGAGTRGDDSNTTSWKDTFKRLDIALIPVDKTKNDSIYRFHQLAADKDFGKLSIRLPMGKYSLVAIASSSSNEVAISSAEKVSFSDGVVTDMAYVYKELDVKSGSMTTNCLLSRAITKMVIASNDYIPADIKKVELKYTGNICTSFNPKTGYGIDATPASQISKSFSISSNRVGKIATFALYAFLPQDSETIQVDLKTYDGDDKVVKALNFDNVVIQLKHITTYTGPLFTSGNNFEFSFDNAELTSGGNDKIFGDE